MSRPALIALVLASAVVTYTLQACNPLCADCNCPESNAFDVTAATDADLVGASLQFTFDQRVIVEYPATGGTWTATYEVPPPDAP